jgi:hypothetical protein
MLLFNFLKQISRWFNLLRKKLDKNDSFTILLYATETVNLPFKLLNFSEAYLSLLISEQISRWFYLFIKNLDKIRPKLTQKCLKNASVIKIKQKNCL